MDERGRKCVFIGYPANTKGYTLYDLKDHSVFDSRDVVFYETHFPYKSSIQTESKAANTDNHIPLPNPCFPNDSFPVETDMPQDIQMEQQCTPQNSERRRATRLEQSLEDIHIDIPITIDMPATGEDEQQMETQVEA